MTLSAHCVNMERRILSRLNKKENEKGRGKSLKISDLPRP